MENIFSISLANFTGPMDVLLDTIREKKLDILNLDLTSLTSQYLKYIKDNLKQINIDEVSDYLVMATYLVELKSKKIIPVYEPSPVDVLDVKLDRERDRLVKYLVEYKRYQQVLPFLEEMYDQRDVFYAKPEDDIEMYEENEIPEAPLPDYISPKKLLKAFENIRLRLAKKNIHSPKIVVHELPVEDIEKIIFSKIQDISSKTKNKKISLTDLLENINTYEHNDMFFVTSFLAILVLCRNQKILLFQKKFDSDIFIQLNECSDNNLNQEESFEEYEKRKLEFEKEVSEYAKKINKERYQKYLEQKNKYKQSREVNKKNSK